MHIGLISPYKADIDIMMERIRDRSEFTVLRGMAPPATVDSYQGQEKDIMCVVMGTTKESGPGFTSKPNRLNVMFSRQKSVSPFQGFCYLFATAYMLKGSHCGR
jgi:superfamily I DNA and/or RNA helicase